ncbi:alpha/beta-hydrolase, partial [Clathrospora elynae]
MIAQSLTPSHHTTPSGTKTHFLQGGNPAGPLLVCLHGLGVSTETFIPLPLSLPQTYKIILVDFQGFGKSPLSNPTKRLSIPGHASNLGTLIASLQADLVAKVFLVGHSLGVIIALHYAAQHPDSVAGLALLGSGRAAGHISAVRQRMLDLTAAVREKGISVAADLAVKSNFYEDTPERTVDPSAREAVRRDVSASDPEGYAQTCEAIDSLDHKDPPYEKIV